MAAECGDDGVGVVAGQEVQEGGEDYADWPAQVDDGAQFGAGQEGGGLAHVSGYDRDARA
jgi:hypothetical protein